MSFPRNTIELEAQGYKFSNESRCWCCGKPIQWWTTPAGRKIPLDVEATRDVHAHFARCPKAKDFRKL